MTPPILEAFPTPGPLLGYAYRNLWLAAEGTENQQQAVGDPSQLPRPWEPATCRDPLLRAELWAWLDDVVTWFNHTYTWDPTGLIPPCWPQHPHLAVEIAVLADQRRRAGISLSSDLYEDWHRYTVPGFQDRLKARLKTHCDHEHQPPPARARHARHGDAAHVGERSVVFDADAAALEPVGDVDFHRPRLSVVDQAPPRVGEDLG